MISAGDLRHRISFIGIDQIPVSSGGAEPVEVVYWQTNAYVEPMKQQRVNDGAISILTNDYKLIVRYRRDKMPDKNMQIDYRGERFVVNSVQQYQEDREMLLIIASKWQ